MRREKRHVNDEVLFFTFDEMSFDDINYQCEFDFELNLQVFKFADRFLVISV